MKVEILKNEGIKIHDLKLLDFKKSNNNRILEKN